MLEIDDDYVRRLWEGKAVITGLFMKMRNKIKTAKNDGAKFKALADMIALSTLFNFDAIQDIFKQLNNEDKS